MKTNKRILGVPLLAVLLFLIFVSASFAQPHGRFHHGKGFFKLDRLSEKLALTDEQMGKIKEGRYTSQKKAIETRSKIQLARLELRELMDADNADEAKISAKVKEIGEFRTQLQLNRVMTRINMKKVLTDEQIEKLKELRMEWGPERGGQRFHRRGPHKPGHFQGRYGPGIQGDDDEDLDI